MFQALGLLTCRHRKQTRLSGWSPGCRWIGGVPSSFALPNPRCSLYRSVSPTISALTYDTSPSSSWRGHGPGHRASPWHFPARFEADPAKAGCKVRAQGSRLEQDIFPSAPSELLEDQLLHLQIADRKEKPTARSESKLPQCSWLTFPFEA